MIMKRTLLPFLLLFPMICISQEVDDELKNLSFDELLNLRSVVASKCIEISPADANRHDVINIGLLLPYSMYHLFSNEVEKSVKLAIDEINASGGVLSKKLQVIPADDSGNKLESIKKASQLVRHYNIKALIGPTGSTRLIHVAEKVTIPNKVCLMSSGTSSSLITNLKDNDLVWRVTPIDIQESAFSSDFIVNELKKKSIGIIFVNNDFGKSLYSNLLKDIKRLGGEVNGVLSYSPLVDYTTYNLKTELDKFFEGKPELIYLVTNPYEGALITQRIEDGKYLTDEYSPIFFSCSSNVGNDFLDNSSDKVLELTYGISQKMSVKPDFVKNFEKKYGYKPSTPEASGMYDIVYIVAYAMIYANSDDPVEYTKHIRKISSGNETIGINEFSKALGLIKQNINFIYEGASGKLTFDNNGDITNPEFEIWRIKNNRFEVVK